MPSVWPYLRHLDGKERGGTVCYSNLSAFLAVLLWIHDSGFMRRDYGGGKWWYCLLHQFFYLNPHPLALLVF